MAEYVLPGYSPTGDARAYKSVARAKNSQDVINLKHVECLADFIITAANPAHEYHPNRWFPWVPALRISGDVTRIRPNVKEGEPSTFPGGVRELKFDDKPLKVTLDYHFCDGVNIDQVDEMVALVQRGLFRDGFGDFEDKLVGFPFSDIPVVCDFTTIMPSKETNNVPLCFVNIENAHNIQSGALEGFILEDGQIARGTGYEPFGNLPTPIARDISVPGVGALREMSQEVAKQAEVEEIQEIAEPEIVALETESEVEIAPVELPEIDEPTFEPDSEDKIAESLLSSLKAKAQLSQRGFSSIPEVDMAVPGDKVAEVDIDLGDSFSSVDEEVKKAETIAAAARNEFAQESLNEYQDLDEEFGDVYESIDEEPSLG